MPDSPTKRGGLLAQIEAGVVDDRVTLSSLLQKCIVLGGQAGSEKMRAWARQELNGYGEAETVPEYRQLPVPLMAMVTNRAGYNGRPVRFEESVFSDQMLSLIHEKVDDLEVAVLNQSLGELEAMANQGAEEFRLIPRWSGAIAGFMNQQNMIMGGRVADVYWSVSTVSIKGVLGRIRTALAELVAELITLTPKGQDVPDTSAADQAVQFVLTGERATINYTYQHATDGGTNAAVNSADAVIPVAVSGKGGSAIGSQIASGANSTVVGSQEASGMNSSIIGGNSAQGGRDAVTAGHDAAIPAEEQLTREDWWARLRKRGLFVSMATIVGAIATVAGGAVTILLAAGWKP